jgi:hypothetical protein
MGASMTNHCQRIHRRCLCNSITLLTVFCVSGCARERQGEVSTRAVTGTPVNLSGKEMIGRPTDTSVTIKAIADRAVEAFFEYRVAGSGGSYSATSSATYSTGVVEAVISGLAANTKYEYQMRYRVAGESTDYFTGTAYTFTTKRAKDAAFTFAVQSDSHLDYTAFFDGTRYQVTMNNILAGNPDLVFDLGDAFSLDGTTETPATAKAMYLKQRAFFQTPGSSAAVFLVLGNHENEEGWNLDDFADVGQSLPVLSANARKRYFLNPMPALAGGGFYTGNLDTTVTQIDGDHLRGDYYAFEWGNTLFVAIDPYWYTMKKPYAGSLGGEKNDEVVGNRWDWSLGQQQYQWLKQTLEGSDAPLKFVFAHQPVGGVDTDNYGRGGALAAKYCEMGGYNIDGATKGFATKRPGWDSPIHELFVKNHVTAFFHGHDHVYAKETLEGVVYQEVPMAAHPSKDYLGFGTNATDYAGTQLFPSSGHLRVSVQSTGATVTYVRSYLPSEQPSSTPTPYEMKGCTPDSDGDGTNDCKDLCPNDATKVDPGACGCGVADTDSDGDGTPDCNDRCPSDRYKTAPGVCGCGVADTDTDGDGTPDCNDLCPSDRYKTAPGICGCGVADTDTDGDGTADCKDLCPNDRKKVAPGVCGCGIADTDTDGDGTPDCNDQCPNDKTKTVPGVCGCGVPEGSCGDLCPNDPYKTSPGQCGCGVPDTDTDKDGTADCNDLCPNDKLKIAPGVCGCGIADLDSDGDGTPNCLDGCPNDRNKVAPGACGCGVLDTDTDGDGTANCNDGCPSDRNKVSPGACGCGTADTDSDGDGTANCNDGCPSDRNKVSPGVCGCGVSDVDTDGDGTPDCSDQCPSDRNKVSPGNCGCGVPESTCVDQCPDDPNKIQAGQCGCGVPDTDSDGDGTADCNDQCSADATKSSPGACGCGVPDTDSDGDGTPNCVDQCPSDPHKSLPGICGCGVLDQDANGNGTIDCREVDCSLTTCACGSVVLTSDRTSGTAVIGSTVHFAAAATCTGGAARYQFRLLRPGSTWRPIRTWSSEASLDWQTAGLAPDIYWIQVWSREATSQRDFDSNALVEITLGN